MRVGIDIDGVLTDVESYQLDFGSKFYLYKYNKTIVNYKGYDTTSIFDGTVKQDNEFWFENIREYIKQPARKYSDEVIQKLKDEGHEIYIITARSSALEYTDMSTEEMREAVREWLAKYGIHYDKLIFSPEDKVDICLTNNIDLMIEDKPKNIMDISKHIPVICYNAGYNENCCGNNITRCYSWYDIYTKIKNI